MNSFLKQLFTFHLNPFDQYEVLLRKILDTLLLIIIIIGIPVISIGITEAIHLDQFHVAVIYTLLFLPFPLLYLLRKDIHYKVIAGIIVTLLFLLASHNIYIYGFSGAGIPLYLTFFILTTIFFGFKKGLLSIILASIPMTIIALLMIKGLVKIDIDLLEISKYPVSWLTAISVMILLGGLMVMSFSFIHFNLLHIVNITRQQANELQESNNQLTEQIRHKEVIQKELEDARDRAEESDKLKSAFLANISHEIRTPMNGILGFANLLKNNQYAPHEQDKYLDIIEKSGQRMLNTINDLVNISMIESGQMNIYPKETNIHELINELFHLFSPEAENKSLHLTVHNPLPKEKTNIMTDKEKVYSALSNLLKNALKYTKEGSINFGYQYEDKSILFFVKDTGQGIHHLKHHLIFDRFTRAENKYSSGDEGVGLGLSIAKTFVEMLGGHIWFRSIPNKGSTFYFNIPASSK